jgi:hypothetical protein
MDKIPIVVIAYNRPASLSRLLGSLLLADYPGTVKLYISIDLGGGRETVDLASGFKWPFGEKEVLLQPEHLGLKKHVMKCAAMVENYRAIIILEDDLYVSGSFYHYTLSAVDFFEDHPKIGGLSLYSHSWNETAQFPFQPLVDESDVFFLQYASSWGQCWTRQQWMDFRYWMEKNGAGDDPAYSLLPPNVIQWPSSSWKKNFIAYLLSTGRFFVYPRISLTTNFADTGQHVIRHEHFLQRPLLSSPKKFFFKQIEDSFAVYDSYCEILPDRLKSLCPFLEPFEFETDLYGMKDPDKSTAGFLLTSMESRNSAMSFGREMKPMEANITGRIPGQHFSLVPRKEVRKKSYFRKLMHCSSRDDLGYHLNQRFYHTWKGKMLLLGGSFFYHPRVYPILAKILNRKS